MTLPSQTLPPNAHTVCYQLDGDNGGTWLKIGADFEVAGATHYTVVPSPLYVQTAFTLSIHGYAFTSADQWAWGAAADACIAPTARDTSEGSLGNNLFTIGMTEAAGNYSVCWSPRCPMRPPPSTKTRADFPRCPMRPLPLPISPGVHPRFVRPASLYLWDPVHKAASTLFWFVCSCVGRLF